MAHLRLGHHDAVAVILERYQRMVWSIAQKTLHDEGEAEDIVQIVFMELFQKVALFDPARGTLKVWLSQLAYTRSINRRCHLQRRQFYAQDRIDEDSVAQFSPGAPALGLTTGESGRLVREALATLGENQKTAVELVAFEGLTFEELAARMQETVSNVKHHYYRGMMKLRECLSSTARKEESTTEERALASWEVKDVRAQSV